MRPYVTAGVALVGAGAIAVTPIAPQPAEVPTAAATVQLAAIPSPLQLYPQVVLQSIANGGALLQQYFADPFPIIRATLENQAAAFADAVTALQLGQVDEFFAAAADIVLQPFNSAEAAFSHLGAILSQPFAVEGFFLIAISPVLSGLAATGQAIAEVFDAITTLDLVGAVNAVINIPARIIDGVLNGVPGASFGILEDLPGLLSPLESSLPPGPIAVGINLDQDMGAAIPPRESSAPVDAVPDPDTATFTLTTDVAPAADSEPDVAATDDPETDPSAGGAVIEGDGDGDGDGDELPSENSTKNRGPESAD
ncbi:hypothetical protein C6A85_96080, partial [Mycobacterium sp. ITM-2017-0098]